MRALSVAIGVLVFASSRFALAAVTFLPVVSTGAATSQFTSVNGYGTIPVTHAFSAGGAGVSDNDNAAIAPSQFTTVFPGSGIAPGHLAQTVYNHTSVVHFDLNAYAIKPDTVFGIWNITDEVTNGTGGPPIYRIELINSAGTAVPPTTFHLIGKGDNLTQVAGRHEIDLDSSTGALSAGALINPMGTHTSGIFWDSIPAGTKAINVYANLPALNTVGDGVGYYFAETNVPEPGSIAAIVALAAPLLSWRRRRARSASFG